MITAEYKKFVHELVKKHKEKPEAYIQTMSTPFSYAFPQYSDILELYDNQQSSLNPAICAAQAD